METRIGEGSGLDNGVLDDDHDNEGCAKVVDEMDAMTVGVGIEVIHVDVQKGDRSFA